MTTPLLSIIVPTHNSETTIEQCILSLTNQSCPREQFEIIVVDDGSKDQTTEIAKNAGADMVIQTKPCFQGKARNIGVENSNANFLAFIDSDCQAKEGWIKTIIGELKTLDVIGGSVENGNPHSSVAWAEYFIEFVANHEYNRRAVSKFMLPGCNLACTKDAFSKVGGFTDERRSEDLWFGVCLKRVGIEEFFIPELKVLHFCRTELDKFSANMKTQGKFYVRNRDFMPNLRYSSLKNSSFLIPMAFLSKLVSSMYFAFPAKKGTKFFRVLPYVILGISSFCSGIRDELKNK